MERLVTLDLKFFYEYFNFNNKNIMNRLNISMINGCWISDVSQIKGENYRFF